MHKLGKFVLLPLFLILSLLGFYLSTRLLAVQTSWTEKFEAAKAENEKIVADHAKLEREFHRALEMLDCQQRVLPDSSTLCFEQGEYWLRLGSVEGARSSFTQAVELGRDREEDAAAAMARRRLAELGDRQDTLH